MDKKTIIIIVVVVAVLAALSVYAYNTYIAPPTVKNTTPANNSTGYSNSSPLTVVFSKKIKEGTNFYKITVIDANNRTNLTITEKTIVGDTLTIKTEPRVNRDWYRVVIPAGAVKDEGGKDLLHTYSFLFRTI